MERVISEDEWYTAYCECCDDKGKGKCTQDCVAWQQKEYSSLPTLNSKIIEVLQELLTKTHEVYGCEDDYSIGRYVNQEDIEKTIKELQGKDE